MRVAEYAAHDALGLAGLIRRGEVTAAEAYAAAVRAMEIVNPAINAVAAGPWPAPLGHAAAGPFAGVPFVLKDLGGHAAGVPARLGSRLAGDGVVRPHDSHLVRMFREAGLAIGALTTTPEFGNNINTEAVLYGSTRNPWDLTRSAGGSSGGTAALVAAGAVPAGHATDGAGSIRVPAAYNGLVGLKPSRGRVSPGPDGYEALSGFAAEFVVTRTMRDCAAMLDAVAVPMPGDKFMVKQPTRPWSAELDADPGRLRIAVHTESWSPVPVDPQVAGAVEAVARELQELGHHVGRAAPEVEWESFIAAETPIVAASLADGVHGLSAATGLPPGPGTLEQTVLLCYEYGRKLAATDVARAMRTVNQVARSFGRFFTEWDLLITPTMNTPPLPLGYHNADAPFPDAEAWMRHMTESAPFAPFFNWTGTPAISLPVGWTSEGLPIGVQLAAPMCAEATLFRVGGQLEAAMPWGGRRPAVHAAR